MSRPQPIDAGPDPVPCSVNPGDGTGRYVHPEGVCACFRGGPAPVRVPAPQIALLADRPGVFDTSAIGRATRRRGALARRIRAWLRRLREPGGSGAR
jgi:hypothetical protein